MNNLANLIKKINNWCKTNKFDLTMALIIILTILLLIGLWRLGEIVPKKEPIRVSHNISFATYN